MRIAAPLPIGPATTYRTGPEALTHCPPNGRSAEFTGASSLAVATGVGSATEPVEATTLRILHRFVDRLPATGERCVRDA